MVVVKRVAALVALGSGLGVSMGGCVALNPVVGEEGDANGSDGSVELIGSATYFVKTIAVAPPSEPELCLPRELPLSIEGDVLCALFSTTYAPSEQCDCGIAGTIPVKEELEVLGRCGGNTGVDCDDYCICQVPPAEGASATDCLNSPVASESSTGWCYIDPSRERGSADLVSHCPSGLHSMLRILPEAVPAGSEVPYVIVCAGGPVILGPTAPGPGAVGTPCYPGSERRYDFSGFSLTEVAFEFGSPDCASNTCLINHFQGRVSCPYGQSAEQAAGEQACSRPGPDGQVTVPVDPQLLARRAEDTVVCSCRCDGPDPSFDYCDCPSDMECARLVPEAPVSGGGAYVGSYCIPRGTGYDPLYPPYPDQCLVEKVNCGDPHSYPGL